MTPLEILEAHESSLNRLTGGTKCRCGWRSGNEPARWVQHQMHVAQVLDEAMREQEAQMRQLIRDMTDPGECWFDHRGGCQEHGYLELKPGELCPHAEAKQLLGTETSDGR